MTTNAPGGVVHWLWLPLLYRRIAVALIAVFALLVGSAPSAFAQNPKPDPAPAAQHQGTTPPASTSSGSTHASSSPAPASASTPAQVVTPAPATSSVPASSSTPATSQPATTSAPKHKVTHRAKAKAAAKKARHAKPAAKKAKPVVHAAKPAAARPVVHPSPKDVTTLPVVPPAGSSGSSLSNRSVLLIAFVLVIAVGVLALAARALWRRVWWWRRYHEPSSGARHVHNDHAVVKDRARVLEPWPDEAKANGQNGLTPGDEPATIATVPSRKTATGR